MADVRRTHRILVVALAASTGAAHAQGAPVPVRVLSTAEAELAKPFTRISSLRELSDGRVIVVDQGEKTVGVVDFARGTWTRIGREGSGPTYVGELRMPEASRGNVAARMMAAAQRTLADAHGRIYRQGRRGGARRAVNCEPDSVAIQRVDLRGTKMDTVGWFPVDPIRAFSTGGGGGFESCGGGPDGPFVSYRTWVVTPDGRIALVSPEPYRITWFSTSGTRTVSPPIPYQRVPVTNAEKQAYRDNYASNPGFAMNMSGDATGRMTVSSRTLPFREPEAWPAQKGPFENSRDAVLASPTGELWVWKQLAHTEWKPMYDIIGPGGELVERVMIPERSAVVGFGRGGAVYIVRRDEDDLQYVQRFRFR
jgi:hypothetical protein